MRFRLSFIIAAALALAACNDGLGPQPWDDTPSTISLYSASRVDLLGFPSAYDFVNLLPLRIEQAGSENGFDIVLITSGGQLQLLPAGAFDGITSRAGIATITGTTFENLAEAPADSAAYSASAVTVNAGDVFAVRSRRATCSFSTAVHYAKIRAVTVDVARGLATFDVVRNPYCNDRSFVPPT